MQCAKCEQRDCYLKGKECTNGKYGMEQEYLKEENAILHKASSRVEAEHYMQMTRLEEIIEFSKLVGFQRLGIAFCIGFGREANLLQQVLEKHFKVYSVCCKCTGTSKEKYGLKHIIPERYEAMCNPIGQAEILNNKATDLNIILGLCIGHDILFTKYCNAPVTTFAVKDRVLAHNPLGALYSSYYLNKKFGLK
ncbi:hypothetical protein SY88_15300 [Clostridiales bacterium PH28_bin88]|nr:hypothetical protein SY88_15300 [Clostridiales bacterium PH28_bin88]